MRKVFCLCLCLLLLLCMPGCSGTKGPYSILPMEPVDGEVDAGIIDQFLTDNADYSFYGELKKNAPELYSELIDITPKEIKDKCSIYKFTYGRCGGLTGCAFLVYDNEVYPLGTAVGGWGVTEFAYINQNGQNMLYYIYSWGSGMHRSHIGVFNFDTKEQMDTGSLYDIFKDEDIAFCLSWDKQTLGICKARIEWKNWDTESLLEIKITKEKSMYDDIRAFKFAAVETGK